MGRPPSNITAEARIFRQLVENPATGCWEWTGSLHPSGYGRVVVGARRFQTHRWVWTFLCGEIPTGLQLDHLCRNRICCNPEHLEPVDNRTNSLRSTGVTARNAVKTHCAQGHAFDEANTVLDRGKRACLTCRRERQLAYYHRTKRVAS